MFLTRQLLHSQGFLSFSVLLLFPKTSITLPSTNFLAGNNKPTPLPCCPLFFDVVLSLLRGAVLPIVDALKVSMLDTTAAAFASIGSLNLKLFMEAIDLGMSDARTNGFEKLKLYFSTDLGDVFEAIGAMIVVVFGVNILLLRSDMLVEGSLRLMVDLVMGNDAEGGGATAKSNLGKLVMGS